MLNFSETENVYLTAVDNPNVFRLRTKALEFYVEVFSAIAATCYSTDLGEKIQKSRVYRFYERLKWIFFIALY